MELLVGREKKIQSFIEEIESVAAQLHVCVCKAKGKTKGLRNINRR